MMEDENLLSEKMTNALIAFQEFLKKFKQVIKDETISNDKENNPRINITYTFREFNLECYIIDKIYFSEFCTAINYNEIADILSNINDESINKCKEIMKKIILENKYNPDNRNIKIYADKESLRGIIKDFGNYSFLNKELLIDCMSVPEENLKSKKLLLSKNEKNTAILNIEENFIMTINIEKKQIVKEKEKEKKENKIEIKKEEDIKNPKIKKGMKNLYYVGDITKKIFLLLYKKDELINKKIEKKVIDPYNFKNYYLINKAWLHEYKSYFLYDTIIRKLEKYFKDYSYKRIKTEMDEIVKDKIGQIKLFGDSNIPDNLKDFTMLEAKQKIIKLNNQNANEEFDMDLETKEPEEDANKSFYIPSEFEIINKDIYELLIKEEFFEKYNEDVDKKLCYQILLGNGEIIIKNKTSEQYGEKDNYSNEILFYKKYNENEEKNQDIVNEEYILKYILNYEKKVNFYEEIKIIINDGLSEFLTNKKINLGDHCSQENIMDENGNFLGKIINICIDKDKDLIIKKGEENIENKIIWKKNDENEIKMENEEESFSKINNIENNNIYSSNNYDIISNKLSKSNKNNNIINEDLNFKGSEINIINADDNKELKIVKDYTIKEIHDKFKNIKCMYKEINKNSINTKEWYDLDINGLVPREIETKLQSKGLEIILLTEDEYNNIIKKYDINKIGEFIEKYKTLKERDKKNKLIEENKKELSNILNNMSGSKLMISEQIDYKKVINNIKEKKKFFALSRTAVKIDIKESIYYIQFKTEPYIYFKEQKRIFKIKGKERNKTFYELEDYDLSKITGDYLISLEQILKNNKSDKIEITKEIINEYYLINDKWIESAIKKKDNPSKIKESFKPEYNNKTEYPHPRDFSIICKDGNNKYMMDNLIQNFKIDKKDIDIKKIFINKYEKIYICIIDGSFIYFYHLKDKNYSLSFIIKYNDEEILNNEVIKNLSLQSIESYINFMIIKEPDILYDMDFKIIGSLINIKKKFDFLKKRNYPNMQRPNMKEYIKLYAILIVLSNIKEFQENFFIDKNLKKDTILFSFLQEMRILWNNFGDKNKKNFQDYENIYTSFIMQINKLSENKGINNIFDNLKSLFEEILLQIQNELFNSLFYLFSIYIYN